MLFAVVLARGLDPEASRSWRSPSIRCSTSPRKAGASSRVRWIVFFVAMAVVNEIVWRTQTTDFWVAFKTFGFHARSRSPMRWRSFRLHAVDNDAG